MAIIQTLSVEDLVGREFEGYFQRDPKLIVQSRNHRERLKLERVELLEQYDILHGSSDSQDAFINRRYDFSMRILQFDPLRAGLFIATGEDLLGVSRLTGQISWDQRIEFTKIYVGPKNPHIPLDRFETISYEGRISRDGRMISMNGTYLPGRNVHNYSGIWQLNSVIDSVLVI